MIILKALRLWALPPVQVTLQRDTASAILLLYAARRADRGRSFEGTILVAELLIGKTAHAADRSRSGKGHPHWNQWENFRTEVSALVKLPQKTQWYLTSWQTRVDKRLKDIFILSWFLISMCSFSEMINWSCRSRRGGSVALVGALTPAVDPATGIPLAI